MKKTFEKHIYDQSEFYHLHHVTGFSANQAYAAALHADNNLTLAYFKQGTGHILIEGNEYPISNGDIFLLNHNELHHVSLDETTYCERITLYIRTTSLQFFPGETDSFFDAFLKREKGCLNHIPASKVQHHGLDTMMEKLLSLSKNPSSTNEILALCKMTELLSQINSIVLPGVTNTASSPTDPLTARVIGYINEHFTEPIGCEEIADFFHINKFHLERLFKKHVGLSLWDYVISRRLLLCNDLIRKNISIADAANQAGFRNYSNFYRLYKKHLGLTPLDFKKSLRS